MSTELPPLGTADIGRPASGADVLWAFVFDLSRRLEPTSRRLVGGLMVVAHGLVVGRTPPRVTRDVDILADIVTGSSGLEACVSAVEALGFEPVVDNAGKVYRFKRATDGLLVDVLAPDHAPPRRSLLTRRSGETIAINGGRQALERAGIVTLNSRDYGRADIPVPDLLGALVLKAAAWRVDSRDRERHSGDAAFLISLVQDPLAEVSRLRGSDRKRLRALDRGVLGSSDAAEWRALGNHGVDGFLAWKLLVDSYPDAPATV